MKPLLYAIDDARCDLLLYERRLEDMFRVRTFKSMSKLIHAIGEEKPAVCLVDFIMPFHSGIEVAEAIKWIDRDIPIIFCTGCNGEEYEILANGFNAMYWHKSSDHQELRRMLQCLI